MGHSGANLVTFGDVWRDACDEPTPGGSGRLAEELSDLAGFEVAVEEVEEVPTSTLKAASKALNSVWRKLTKDPDENEVRKNLEAFAKMHGGAVAAPFTEENVVKKLQYTGLFPDIVDALIEEDLEAEDLEKDKMTRELKARVSTLESDKVVTVKA
jgi:uncharacterized protein YceH (UPF0502 family)